MQLKNSISNTELGEEDAGLKGKALKTEKRRLFVVFLKRASWCKTKLAGYLEISAVI